MADRTDSGRLYRAMNRARGFTLIEILVALTMFAVVGGTLLQLFELGLRTVRKTSEHTHAVLLARSKMTELLTFNDLRPGTLTGKFEGGYRWRAELQIPPNAEKLQAGLLQPLDLAVTIDWGDEPNESRFRLDTLTLTQSDEQ